MRGLLLCLLACDAPAPARAPWTREGAFAPHLLRLDRDGDGRVTDPEWAPVAYAAPALGNLDADGDDALSVAELLSWLEPLDPLFFDGAHRSPPAEEAGAPALGPQGRWTWEELTLRGESHAKRGLAVPTSEQVEAAVAQEALEGPAAQAARAVLDAETPDAEAASRPPVDARVRARLDAHVREQLGWGPTREGAVAPGIAPP